MAAVLRFGADAPVVYVVSCVVLAPAWVAIVAGQRGYEDRFLGSGGEEYRRLLNAGLILVTVLAVASYAVKFELSRAYVLIAVPTTVLLALAARHFMRHWVYRARRRGNGLQRVLVAGQADNVAATVDLMRREPEHGLACVGLCVPQADVRVSEIRGIPVVGTLETVLEAAADVDADVVAVVAHPDLSGHVLRRLAWALEEREVDLVVAPGIVEVAGPRLSIRPIAGLALLHLDRPATAGARLLLKALIDRVGALLLLVAVLPVLAGAVLAIRLTSPGPAIFRQIRIGVDGRPFTMLKLRTMVDGAHAMRVDLTDRDEGAGVLFKIRNDPRVTPVGAVLRRLSIDELPQLVNVLRGHMSLVGPRPPLPEEVAQYSADATRRLRVRPGLTGLWQVSGRSDLTWEESLRLDLRYVDNWCLGLDLSILWRTGRAILRRSGAY